MSISPCLNSSLSSALAGSITFSLNWRVRLYCSLCLRPSSSTCSSSLNMALSFSIVYSNFRSLRHWQQNRKKRKEYIDLLSNIACAGLKSVNFSLSSTRRSTSIGYRSTWIVSVLESYLTPPMIGMLSQSPGLRLGFRKVVFWRRLKANFSWSTFGRFSCPSSPVIAKLERGIS